ncbi:hypothetical protein Ptr902_01195 [Pyrenophora tritici-repentis]|nr:hypothetical protein Ptr902_01195 [Pyrenophora tritici-repentis]
MYEAHDEYEWPTVTGYDFAQAMRIRRALVNDVFVALEKTGRVKLVGEQAQSVPNTLQSSGKKVDDTAGGSNAGRKRKRKNEDRDYESDKFLSKTMRELLIMLKGPISVYTKQISTTCGVKPEVQLADIVHDTLVYDLDDLDNWDDY